MADLIYSGRQGSIGVDLRSIMEVEILLATKFSNLTGP